MTDREAKSSEALEEARRAIAHQAESLDELRARTGVLLAASSVSAAVLGSSLGAGGVKEFGVLGVTAGAAFVLALMLCVRVLWPKKDAWTFSSNAKVLVEDWVDVESRDVVEMRSFVAEKLHGYLEDNKKSIDHLVGLFQLAALATGVQVILGVTQMTVG